MVTSAKHLYRSEFFEAKKNHYEGQIMIKPSFNQNVYLCFSVVLLCGIIAFIIFAEYTRRDTLVGIVSPVGGMVNIQANDSGYIEKLFVQEGDKVDINAPLYHIRTERFDQSGQGVKHRLINSIEAQYQLLQQRRKQESGRVIFEKQIIDEDIERLSNEITILKQILELSSQELTLAKKLVAKQKTLVNNQYMSEIEYQKQLLELISLESQSQTHHLNLQKLLREKQQLVNTKLNLDIDLNINLKDLDRQLEAITQSKIETLYQGDTQVMAPITGIITSVLAEQGHSVTNGQTLAVVIPEGKQAFVELYASSRSIGFIKHGQQVRLRFDAFPYEKFGVQSGVVSSVSRSAVAPEMITNQNLLSHTQLEGLYQVRIALEKPTITVYGNEEYYIPGMTVTADIELDTRKIYEWMLEPLYTIKGRI